MYTCVSMVTVVSMVRTDIVSSSTVKRLVIVFLLSALVLKLNLLSQCVLSIPLYKVNCENFWPSLDIGHITWSAHVEQL